MDKPDHTQRLKRGSWINSRNLQCAIVVRDASGSMAHEKKALDASTATNELIEELAHPANKDGFILGVIDFDVEVTRTIVPQRATTLGAVPPIHPRAITNLTAGLLGAEELLDQAESSSTLRPEGTRFLPHLVILFSDGGHNEGPPPEDVAARLAARGVILVTIAFGSKAHKDRLKALSTNGQCFRECRNGRELRAFFAQVGGTLAASVAAGKAFPTVSLGD
jgi:Mg-chelatase subunit ChlD